MRLAARFSRLRLDEVLRDVVQRQSEVLAEAVRQAHPEAGAVGVRLDDSGAVIGTDDAALAVRERGMAGVPPRPGLAAVAAAHEEAVRRAIAEAVGEAVRSV
jgi:hypothetical protein